MIYFINISHFNPLGLHLYQLSYLYYHGSDAFFFALRHQNTKLFITEQANGGGSQLNLSSSDEEMSDPQPSGSNSKMDTSGWETVLWDFSFLFFTETGIVLPCTSNSSKAQNDEALYYHVHLTDQKLKTTRHCITQCCGTGTGNGTVGAVTFWLMEPEPEPEP